MSKQYKTRKVELIIYGYGIRSVHELEEMELEIDYENSFKAHGKITNIEFHGRKKHKNQV